MSRKAAVSAREPGGREGEGRDNLHCVQSSWEGFELLDGIGVNELILSHSCM